MSTTPKAFHSYFGGKNKMAKDWISHYVPRNAKTYVEPFAGSFAVYFFTNLSEDTEVIFNDFNKDQANLFSCSKNYKKLLERIEYNLYNKEGFLYCEHENIEDRKIFYKEKYYDIKKSDFHQREFDLGDYDRASIYAFLLTSAFNSVNYMAGGFSGFNKDRMKLLTLINKLNDEYVQEKLNKITEIYSVDFEELIKKYDSPDTIFYLDPPYYTGNEEEDTGKRTGWYGASDIFDKNSHKRLCDLLKTLQGKWILSYYAFDLLEEWLPKDKYKWVSKEYFRSSASFSDKKNVVGEELLIMNYEIDEEEFEKNKQNFGKKAKKTTKKSKSTKLEKIKEKIDEHFDKTSPEEIVENLEKRGLEFEDIGKSDSLKEFVNDTRTNTEENTFSKEKFDECFESNLEGFKKERETEESLYGKSGLKELEDIKPVVPEDKEEMDDFWD